MAPTRYQYVQELGHDAADGGGGPEGADTAHRRRPVLPSGEKRRAQADPNALRGAACRRAEGGRAYRIGPLASDRPRRADASLALPRGSERQCAAEGSADALSRRARESRAVIEPVPLRSLPDTPVVSVIIPCYNQGHFLTDAIESVLGQTYSRVEVIVVDDGSTDATSNIASAYRDVRYVRQENQGLARARNRGLRGTVGECVVFLDSDDRLRPRAA